MNNVIIPEKYLTDHLLIVNFHHVRHENDRNFPLLHYRSVNQFKSQVVELGKFFEFIDPSDVADLAFSNVGPIRSKCILTFDDGLLDHYENVFPALEDLKLKGLFFVNTKPWEDGMLLSVHMAHLLSAAFSYEELAEEFEYVAQKKMPRICQIVDLSDELVLNQYRYDSLKVAKIKYFLNVIIPQELRENVLREVFKNRLGNDRDFSSKHYLNADMVKEMSLAGHSFGLHTHSHLHLASADSNFRVEDLKKNKKYLSSSVSKIPSNGFWVSYPYGSASSFDENVINECTQLGCSFGLSMIRGLNDLKRINRMSLKRFDTNDVLGGNSPIPAEKWIV
jgi:peptidoglycan/xylan/chitin deacetylase (PgdA/CDA1 family)